MPQSRDNDQKRLRDKWAVSHGAIVLSGVAVLSISGAIAWLLHPGVGSAIAQGGTQVAARTPESKSKLIDSDLDRARIGTAVTPPRIGRITIEIGQPTLVEGIAPSSAPISLTSNGQMIGQTKATVDGTWLIAVESGLGRGDHRLLVRATSAGSGGDQFSDMVRVSTPQGFIGPLVVTFGQGDASAPVIAAVPSVLSAPVGRVAQPISAVKVADGTVGSLREWLERADRGYRDVVVKNLSAAGEPQTSIKIAAPAAVLAQAQTPPPVQPKAVTPDGSSGSVFDGVLNWLKRSSDTYQKSIVKRLAEPAPTLESLEAKAKADEAKKAADAKTGEDAQQKARDELRAAQAKRDADLKAAEAAAAKATAETAAKAPVAAPKAEDEAAKKVAEDKRIADETLKRQADLKAAEEKRAANQKAADDKRVADEAAKRAADLKAADAKKAADDAAARDAALKKTAEEKRVADEAAKLAADLKAADAKKAADEAAQNKLAEDKRIADEAAKRAADLKTAEAKRAADEVRLAQETAQRAAAEAKKAADMAREAEMKRQADLKVAEEARQAAAKVSNQQADAARAAAAKAADDVRRRAAALAEAASNEATARITSQPAVPPKQPEAKRTAVAPQPSKPPVATVTERVARVSPPPARRRPPIDTSTRSALGAGSGARAVARKPVDAADDGCRNAGRRIKPPGYYVVSNGDSLWDIADMHYGDGGRFQVIERANRKIDDPDMIKPCQRVFIPAPKRG